MDTAINSKEPPKMVRLMSICCSDITIFAELFHGDTNTGFAYIIAFLVKQLGSLVTGNGNIIGTVLALVILAGMIYLVGEDSH